MNIYLGFKWTYCKINESNQFCKVLFIFRTQNELGLLYIFAKGITNVPLQKRNKPKMVCTKNIFKGTK